MKHSVRMVMIVGSICMMSQVDANSAAPSAKEADEFVARVNHELQIKVPQWQAAAWVAANYITDDTQRLAALANEETLAYNAKIIDESKRFANVKGLSPVTARALLSITSGNTLLSPADDAQRSELATLAARLEANYGSAKWCHADADGNQRCLSLEAISDILRNRGFVHSPAELTDAWKGWHDTARKSRGDYQRFVELANAGARNYGFADTGDMWRSGYDMSAAQFSSEVERLWKQVEPLYKELHCYARNKLNAKYGDTVVSKTGPIPAQLLGDMWAQDWGNLYPMLEPYPGISSGDVTATLKSMRDKEYETLRAEFKGTPTNVDLADMEHAANKRIAEKMTRIAEDFYTSIGMQSLPDSFWKNSTVVRPRDRDMVCHASAWDFDLSKSDVRLKQCLEPNEEELFTVHHELGHIYYFLNYLNQPPLFQRGAHDGFHEAIGDTITLSITPQHLAKIGLLQSAPDDPRVLINAQMKKALDKIAFLPFGKLVDQWRWQVFSGQTTADHYNADWWKLREKYQGVSAPVKRDENDFDPGAKYHVSSNTPYTRYFLSFIIQFQFQKALCNAAGYKGELAKCDIYGNKAAGEKYMAMLRQGGSQPWQDTLYQLTGTRQMDGSAIIEYFHPLMGYLKEQNKGQKCGW